MILQANKDLRLCSSFSFLCVCMTFAHYKRNVHGYCKQMYKVEAAKREEKKLLASRDIITLTAQIYTTYIYVSEIVLYNFFCTLSCLLFRFLIFLFRFFHRNYFFLVLKLLVAWLLKRQKCIEYSFTQSKEEEETGFLCVEWCCPCVFVQPSHNKYTRVKNGRHTRRRQSTNGLSTTQMHFWRWLS